MNRRASRYERRHRNLLFGICGVFSLLCAVFATVNLDTDEFHVIREPYELLGGDYTRQYLANGEVGNAASTVLRSYFFHWQYRPIFSPVIAEQHKDLFAAEEQRFGYVKPESVEKTDPNASELYRSRLIVPEPDRLYSHGAGKPLLASILTIPSLALVSASVSGSELIEIQFSQNYHPVFMLVRLAHFLAGLAAVLLVHHILSSRFSMRRALSGTALFAFFPLSIMYFPNLHQDAILTPFILGAAYFWTERRIVLSGVLFGLALASKNTAIFLLPAIAMYELWRIFDKPANHRGSLVSEVGSAVKSVAAMALISLAVLLPFANPVSYAIEILTPLIDRPFDPRGYDVSSFSVVGGTSEPSAAGSSTLRSVTSFVKSFLSLNTVFVLFAVIAIGACFSRKLSKMAQLSLVFLLMVFPYSLVFGAGFGYRQLMFLPFFVILCAEVVDRRFLTATAALFFVVTLLYTVDPMTSSGGLRTPASDQTFLDFLLGR